MTVLLIILLSLVAYLTIGLGLSRLWLPYYIRQATHDKGTVYRDENMQFTQAKRLTLIHDQVRRDTYFMTFLWPAYLPVSLSHRQTTRLLESRDPNEIVQLQTRIDELQTRQLRLSRGADPESDDE